MGSNRGGGRLPPLLSGFVLPASICLIQGVIQGVGLNGSLIWAYRMFFIGLWYLEMDPPYTGAIYPIVDVRGLLTLFQSIRCLTPGAGRKGPFVSSSRSRLTFWLKPLGLNLGQPSLPNWHSPTEEQPFPEMSWLQSLTWLKLWKASTCEESCLKIKN